MTKGEFLKTMKTWNVSSRYYSISEETKENAVNLEKTSDDFYSVYYLERGEKIETRNFTKIEDAYDEVARVIKCWIDLGSDVSKTTH